MDVIENFNKSFVKDVQSVVMIAGIPQADTHQEGIIIFIELLLRPPFLGDAGVNEGFLLILEANRNTHIPEINIGNFREINPSIPLNVLRFTLERTYWSKIGNNL